MAAYYNENNREAAAWLRELIKADAIAPGVVDERDIRDVYPSDLDGFEQCHFFAGIGVWSYALRLAGWRDEEPVWTGSCPCQPFSAAGQGGGFADERHLWPAWFHLIEERRPRVVFGEQVASPDGLVWLDLVQADLEAAGAAFAAVDLCAAGFGTPHIRQRLWFVADASNERWSEGCAHTGGLSARDRSQGLAPGSVSGRATLRLADADGGNTLAEGIQRGWQQRLLAQDGGGSQPEPAAGLVRPGALHGFWRSADWLFCRDHKWRPVEPGSFPLAHGIAARMGRLRGYGNCIVAEAAAAFIQAYRGVLT